ncbi:MAG: hypothetical protein GSR81_02690 [Desulfurococcales archaeon]|nr:hypothetical protein [Desulfurococcales archaeon]
MQAGERIVSIPYYQLKIWETGVSYRYVYGEAYLFKAIPEVKALALVSPSNQGLYPHPYPNSIKFKPLGKEEYVERLRQAIKNILEVAEEEPKPVFDVGGFKGLIKMVLSNLFGGSKARAKPRATPYLEKRLALGYLVDVLEITSPDVRIAVEKTYWRPLRIIFSRDREGEQILSSVEYLVDNRWIEDRVIYKILRDNRDALNTLLEDLTI